MATELVILAWTLVLALVHVFAAGISRTRQYGSRWGMGPRDGEMPPLAPLPGRLQRAQQNFFETFPLFAVAVLIAALTGQLSTQTLVGAHLYFWARLAYLPIYALGVPMVRSLVWGVAFLGLLLILAAILF